jgi:hypothetical protein
LYAALKIFEKPVFRLKLVQMQARSREQGLAKTFFGAAR